MENKNMKIKINENATNPQKRKGKKRNKPK